MLPRLFILFLLVPTSFSYKILVYNVLFGHSHSQFLGRIADILAEAGHNVTVLAPIVDTAIGVGSTKAQVINVPQDAKTAEFIKELYASGGDHFWEGKPTDVIGSLFVGHVIMKGLFCSQCDATVNHPGLIERLKAEKYDVFINENFDFCGIGLSHAIAPKATILVSTTTLFDNVAYDLGIPVMPSFNPGFSSVDLDIHSIWSRFVNVVRTNLNLVMWGPALNCANDVMHRKFGADYPDLRNLTGEAAFVFTNSEPLIDFARPLLRKVIDLGGIGMKEPKELNEHWNRILSLRPKTIIVSFGSNAKSITMSDTRKHALLKAFIRFPEVTFIWKYEALEDPFAKEHVAKVENVILSEWMPQNDLLNDPRLTAFIFHAGMGSCQEAAARGVPGLFIPLIGDQPRNAAMMEHSGIGIAFDKFALVDEMKISEAIEKLLTTESLRVNAKRISSMLAARPFSPRDLLLKHVEFAAEFGPAKALTPRGIQLGWIQYFLIDIIAIAIAVGSAIFLLLSYAIYRLTKRIFWQTPKPKQS